MPQLRELEFVLARATVGMQLEHLLENMIGFDENDESETLL